MPPSDDQRAKHFKRWPFAIFFLAIAVVNVILIVVSAPTWARLIPAWIVLIILLAALPVLLRRRAHARRESIRHGRQS